MFVDESGILHVKILNWVTIDHEDMVDNFLVARHLTQKNPVLKFVDARGHWWITNKAHTFALVEDCPERTIAKAILVNGLISKMINTFLMKRSKPKIPIRFFLSEKEAFKWLNLFRNKT